MAKPDPSRPVDPDDRREKKHQEALRLRDVPPARTLRMGFGMMEFGRKLREAGDRASS